MTVFVAAYMDGLSSTSPRDSLGINFGESIVLVSLAILAVVVCVRSALWNVRRTDHS